MRSALAIISLGFSLHGCGGPTEVGPHDPKALADYRATVKCASASVGAVALLAGNGRPTSIYEDAAMRVTTAAVEAGNGIGKERDEVMADIKATFGAIDNNDEAVAAMEADLGMARDCLPRLD